MNRMAEQKLDYSYKVLETLTASMRRVKQEPGLFARFLYEYVQKAPEIMDAIEPLIKEEHLGVVGDMVKATTEMYGECLVRLAR